MPSRNTAVTGRINRRSLLAAGGAVAVIGLLSRTERNHPAESHATEWGLGVPVPLARSEMPAAVIDDQIYLAGGFYEGARADRFDTVANTWTGLTDLPVAVHHPGVAALDGNLYVAGGYTSDGHVAVANLWRLSPDSTSWRMLSPLPRPKGAFGLVGLGGTLYAVGGAFDHLGGSASNDLLQYDLVADVWAAKSPLPTAREHLAVCALGGRIYAVGGRADGHEDTALGGANESYDPSADAWEKLSNLPVARSGLAGVAAATTVIVFGGERGQSVYDDVNRFDPTTGAWDQLPRLGTARHGLAGAFAGDTLYAIAGSTLAGGINNTAIVETLSLNSIATPLAS